MPLTQLTYKLSLREALRPRCSMCRARMEVLRVVPGRPGFEHWTIRCRRCGLIHEAQAPADPIHSDALGGLVAN
jgi:uncharacterized Zn finger protein